MVSINSQELARSFMFANEVPDIKIITDKDIVRLVIQLDDNGGETIYDETLTPHEGEITVTDIDGMILPYLRKSLFRKFWILATVEGASAGAYLGALYLAEGVTLMTDSTSFVENRFLSVLDGLRRTSIGRKEVLHVFTTEDTTATIRDYYTDGTCADRIVDLVVVMDTGDSKHHGYSMVDASSVPADGKELMRYVVTVGNRTQEYIIDGEHEEPTGVMMFINSFGVPEYLYVNANVKGMPEYERSAATINGVYRNYKVKETRYWEANTGLLTEEEEEWMLEMLRSQEVYIYQHGDEWKEITIVESEAKNTSDPSAMSSYKFKFRLAQRRQTIASFRNYPTIFTGEYNRIFR